MDVCFKCFSSEHLVGQAVVSYGSTSVMKSWEDCPTLVWVTYPKTVPRVWMFIIQHSLGRKKELRIRLTCILNNDNSLNTPQMLHFLLDTAAAVHFTGSCRSCATVKVILCVQMKL